MDEREVARPDRALSFRLRADDGLDPSRSQLRTKFVRVVAGVADQCVTTRVVEQLGRCDELMAFTRGQRDVENTCIQTSLAAQLRKRL